MTSKKKGIQKTQILNHGLNSLQLPCMGPEGLLNPSLHCWRRQALTFTSRTFILKFQTLCIVPLWTSKKKNSTKSSKCNSEPSTVLDPHTPFQWVCRSRGGEPALVLCSMGAALWTRASSIVPPRLAGVTALLVAHQWAVVAQDVHGVLPVPTGAAEVLEAVLWERTSQANKSTRKSHAHLRLPSDQWSLNQASGSLLTTSFINPCYNHRRLWAMRSDSWLVQ